MYKNTRRLLSIALGSLLALLLVGSPALAQSGNDSNTAPDQSRAQAQANNNSTGQPSDIQGTRASDTDAISIKVNGNEIFKIRDGVGPFSKETRAENVRTIMASVRNDRQYVSLLKHIVVFDTEFSSNVMIGERCLTVVTDHDAALAGSNDRRELARLYASRLKDALEEDIKEHEPQKILMAVGLTVVLAILMMALLWLLNWIFPKLINAVHSAKNIKIKSWRIQNTELLSADTIVDVITGTLKVAKVSILLSIFLIFVPLILSLFPETREHAAMMVDHVVTPITQNLLPALFGYLPNIFVIFGIVVVSYYLIEFVHFIFKEIERDNINIAGFDNEWADPTYKIVRFLIITFAFVLIFPYLPGSGSPAFQQVSIFLGVLLSLGSTGAVSHLVAGVFLTYTGAFKVGDRVKIADAVGDVVEKTLLATRINTIKNELITIPNGMVLGSHIINYSSSTKSSGLILNTTISIGYATPWQDVHQALIDAALATEHIMHTPPPFVLQTGLEDFYVKYQLNAYTNAPQIMAYIYSQLHANIQDKFNEAGIEIMSPHYEAQREGQESTIPAAYRKG